MKTKITFCATFLFVSSLTLRASLEDILAPLPILAEASTVFTASKSEENAQVSVKPEVSTEMPESVVDIPVAEARPLAVELEKPFYPITEGSLLTAIEEQMHAHLRPAGKITLTPIRALPDLSKHSEPYEVKLSRLPGRLSKNTIYLSIQVENEEGVLGNWDIPFKPALYSEVWFAKRYLRERELAAASDFEARQVDLLYEPDAVVATLEVLQQHEYNRDIRPGQPLKWGDLAERSLVRKGQVVDVIAYQGMIGISMRAKAQQDGVRGEMVFLSNLESNKNFSGEVIGEGRVQVTF
jgi:flagella basal body P-ring formation protein FlgA